MQNKDSIGVVVGLLLLMLITRSQHFAAMTHLPDASWAVFFLGGMLVRVGWGFPAFLLAAVGADALAVYGLAGNGACVTAAYLGLIPAYYALWWSGRCCSAATTFGRRGLMALLGGGIAELLSSGSYWWLNWMREGYPEQDVPALLGRQWHYLVMDMTTMLGYLVMSVMMYHLLVYLLAAMRDLPHEH